MLHPENSVVKRLHYLDYILTSLALPRDLTSRSFILIIVFSMHNFPFCLCSSNPASLSSSVPRVSSGLQDSVRSPDPSEISIVLPNPSCRSCFILFPFFLYAPFQSQLILYFLVTEQPLPSPAPHPPAAGRGKRNSWMLSCTKTATGTARGCLLRGWPLTHCQLFCGRPSIRVNRSLLNDE